MINCASTESLFFKTAKEDFSFYRLIPLTYVSILFTDVFISSLFSFIPSRFRFSYSHNFLYSPAISSLWFPFSNRDGGGSSGYPLPAYPVSLILSARFTSGIRSSKQINCATPLELIGELVILGGKFRRKFTASFSDSPRIEIACCTMARMGLLHPG